MADRGRPTKYTDDLGDKLIRWMRNGYSLTAAAGKIGISRQTVYAWAEEKPAFSDALNEARAAAAAWWEDRAQDVAMGKEGNAAMVIFGLKNRVADEWRDKQEHAHTSPDGSMTPTTIDASKLDDDTLRKLMDAQRASNSDQ